MEIPNIWLWTWKIQDERVIQEALDIGYHHFDTAWIYNNERILGKVFDEEKTKREQLRITTKVWFDYVPDYKPHEFLENDFCYSQLESRLKQTFIDLKTEYLDLVLLHWPTDMDNDIFAFEKLLNYKREGRIRHLWVSNFPYSKLRNLYSYVWEELEFLEIEKHACLSNEKAEAFAHEKGIKIIAYSPLWHGHLLKNPLLEELAAEEQVSVAQLCIAYIIEKWCICIPKSSSKERLLENYHAKEIHLSEKSISIIDSMTKNHRYNNPPFAPDWED